MICCGAGVSVHCAHGFVLLVKLQGTTEQLTVSKAQFARIPDGYNALRKTSWGGVFPAIQASTIAERARVTKKNKRTLTARERTLLEADTQQTKAKSAEEEVDDEVAEEEVVAASRTTAAAVTGRTSSRLRLRDLVRQQRRQAARNARLARQGELEEDPESP